MEFATIKKTGRHAMPIIVPTREALRGNKRWKNLKGKRFGSLTVVNVSHVVLYKYLNGKSGNVNNRHVVYYECLCDCGTTLVKPSSALVNKPGMNQSCGCSRNRTPRRPMEIAPT